MRTKIFLLIILFSASRELFAQGCVAIRSNGAVCTMEHADSIVSKWQFAANTRYFKSFRHFVGYAEQPQRVELGTEVINHNYSNNLASVPHMGKHIRKTVTQFYDHSFWPYFRVIYCRFQ